MNILRKLFAGESKYDAVLANCDLAMARDEIIDFHKMVKPPGEAEGGHISSGKNMSLHGKSFATTRTLTVPEPYWKSRQNC